MSDPQVKISGGSTEPQWVEVQEGNRVRLRLMKKVWSARTYLPYRRAVVTGHPPVATLATETVPIDPTPTFTVEDVAGYTVGESHWEDA
jgi:hypothetical protein